MIWAHQFDNLPDLRIFLSNMLHVILQISLIGEENLPHFRIQMLAALHFTCFKSRPGKN